jgi:hypothetical protein
MIDWLETHGYDPNDVLKLGAVMAAGHAELQARNIDRLAAITQQSADTAAQLTRRALRIAGAAPTGSMPSLTACRAAIHRVTPPRHEQVSTPLARSSLHRPLPPRPL